MPEASNAIRYDFDEDEPAAVVFNPKALPGALVSWAWSQLMTVDSLLATIAQASHDNGDEFEVAGAVRAVIVPVINALEFSELRAHELQQGVTEGRKKKRKNGAGRRGKRPSRKQRQAPAHVRTDAALRHGT